MANERRATAEEALNKILEDPVLAAPVALSTDAALMKKNQDLAEQMKAKDLQIEILTTCFLGKEKTLEDTIQQLKAQLEQAQKELETTKASTSSTTQIELEPRK